MSFLREAAGRVASSWVPEGDDAASEKLVVDELDRLVHLLESNEHNGSEIVATPPHGFLRRRLLEKLRSQLIGLWAEAPTLPSADEVLNTLASFERVGQMLDPRAERRSRPRSGTPNGLELLVEVAHDFRSPLTSIMYLSEALRRGQDGVLTDLQRRQISIIYNAALTLISTASDVIEMASAGEILADPEPHVFRLAETMDSVQSVVRPIAEEKGIALIISCADEKPRVGNPVALSRVLLNLTTNALKFTDRGEVEIAVTEREQNQLEFSVRDTGRGIPADILATLYQPFRRTDGRTSGYYFSGSGLGLAICRKLVRVMGSELHVETELNSGTRFFFELDLPAGAAE